jgi:hypothetical protein
LSLSIKPVVYVPVEPIQAIATRMETKVEKPRRRRRGAARDGKGQLVDIDA